MTKIDTSTAAVTALQSENLEQSRLLGMSAERELNLIAERDAAILRAEQAEARAAELKSSNEEARKFLRQRDKLNADLARARSLLADMIDAFEEHVCLPEKNCSCHIAPPCGDCEQYSFAREAIDCAKYHLRKTRQEAGHDQA